MSKIAGAFAPSAETILPALQAGAGALKGGEPVSTGIGAGLAQPIKTMEQKAESGLAEKLKLTPEKYAKGEVSYGRPPLPLTELEKLNIPGYTPSYSVGKGGASVRLAPTKVAKPSATKPGLKMTEAAAKQRVTMALGSNPDLQTAVMDEAAKNGWVSAFNKLKAKGYLQ
jgi:hypothetical protein